MSDQNNDKAVLTDFQIIKQTYRIKKLIFSGTLIQNLANIAMRIIFINNLYK